MRIGEYVAKFAPPVSGWSAYFVELTYDVGLPVPLKLTTGVRVVPDDLPYADKPLDLPHSITVVFTAPADSTAESIVSAVQQLSKQSFPLQELSVKQSGTVGYLNWRPNRERSREEVSGVTKFLKEQQCTDIRYQLESGLGITTTTRK